MVPRRFCDIHSRTTRCSRTRAPSKPESRAIPGFATLTAVLFVHLQIISLEGYIISLLLNITWTNICCCRFALLR
ncbi:hypothetical protein V1522DRAFT_399461 [Lipomyces starkeyi]